jgi:cytochrome c oxidase cbb3-type subunit 3
MSRVPRAAPTLRARRVALKAGVQPSAHAVGRAPWRAPLALLVSLPLLAAVTLSAGACGDRPSAAVMTRAPAGTRHAIGPIPGPGEPAEAANPFAGDATAIAEGRRLFVWMNCAGCHGGHAGGGMGPSLRDETWVYGGSDADIYDSIASGRALGMPAWGTLLPPDSLWKMTAYIRSLRTPEEADPPR